MVRVLWRKLAAVELKFGRSEFEKQHYALLALMCIYGIELLDDNIVECRENLLELFDADLKLEPGDEFHAAAAYVLSQNLIHGDALTMWTIAGDAIVFAEWGYLGKGRFQRRDFRLDVLTQSSAFSQEGRVQGGRVQGEASGASFGGARACEAGTRETSLRLENRDDISAAATPWSCSQSDGGTESTWLAASR